MAILNHSFPNSPEHMEQSREGARIIHYIGGYRLLRLPRANQRLEVLDGSAWITMGGEDIILAAGDRFELTEGHDFALVSSAQKKLLILAVTG